MIEITGARKKGQGRTTTEGSKNEKPKRRRDWRKIEKWEREHPISAGGPTRSSRLLSQQHHPKTDNSAKFQNLSEGHGISGIAFGIDKEFGIRIDWNRQDINPRDALPPSSKSTRGEA